MEEIKKDDHMSNIDTLKSTIQSRGGFANTNRFSAEFTVPTSLTGSQQKDQEFLSLSCESINMPGRQIESLDYSMYRNTIKIPTGYANDEINITFRLSEDFFAKKVFDEWQRYIIKQDDYLVSYFNDYTTDMTLKSLNKENEVMHEVKLLNCYPLTVGGIEKSNETTDEILRLQVTIAYRDFESKYYSAKNAKKSDVSIALNDPTLFNNTELDQFRGIV